jgi:flagellar protein FliO/FliZ
MFDALFSSLPVRFFIAFLIVLGLIGALAWVVRRFGTGRLGGANTRGRQPRLGVIDYASVDARRRLILVRRDNVEHLLMIGGPTDVVVEANIVRAVAANPRDAVIPRSPTMEMPRAMPLPEPSNGGSWPLQPEPLAPSPAPRAASKFEPLPDEPAIAPLQPLTETPAKPQRDTLAALADELSARPAPPTAPVRNRNPLPARKPQAEARVPEPRTLEPRLPDPPPGPAAAPVDASTDQSLAEMAHRLEAALRKPGAPAAPAAPQAAAPAEAAPPQRAPRQADPKPAPRADAKPNKSTTLYDNLEQEMASLLGRPPNKN